MLSRTGPAPVELAGEVLVNPSHPDAGALGHHPRAEARLPQCSRLLPDGFHVNPVTVGPRGGSPDEIPQVVVAIGSRRGSTEAPRKGRVLANRAAHAAELDPIGIVRQGPDIEVPRLAKYPYGGRDDPCESAPVSASGLHLGLVLLRFSDQLRVDPRYENVGDGFGTEIRREQDQERELMAS